MTGRKRFPVLLAAGADAGLARRTLRPRRRGRRLCLPPPAVTATYALPGLTGTPGAVVTMVAEESLSRGVNQYVLSRLGVVRATIWVAVRFGLGHLVSGLWFDRPGDDTLAQVVSTTAYGFGLAAMRWRLATVWPLAGLHTADNFAQLRSPGAAPLWWQAAIAVLFVAYRGWLLRSAGLGERPAVDGS